MAAAAQKGRAAPQLAIKKEGLLWFKASEAAKENERKAKSRE